MNRILTAFLTFSALACTPNLPDSTRQSIEAQVDEALTLCQNQPHMSVCACVERAIFTENTPKGEKYATRATVHAANYCRSKGY